MEISIFMKTYPVLSLTWYAVNFVLLGAGSLMSKFKPNIYCYALVKINFTVPFTNTKHKLCPILPSSLFSVFLSHSTFNHIYYLNLYWW